jgi:hypothetical protein
MTAHSPAQRVNHEEDLGTDPTNHLPPLFAVPPSLVSAFDTLGIPEYLQGVREVHTVVDDVGVTLRLVPLERYTAYTG